MNRTSRRFSAALATLVWLMAGMPSGLAADPATDSAPAADTAPAADSDSATDPAPADAPPPAAPAPGTSPFKDLPGRWVGDGKIGLKDGKTETVKCRATYFLSSDGSELKQNIRCASASGNTEVKSVVTYKDGKLSGTWNELIYNLGGELSGEVTSRGFRIAVRGSGLTANMDVIVMNTKQVVEIQFFESTLRGLTLVLQKG